MYTLNNIYWFCQWKINGNELWLYQVGEKSPTWM